jgi:hypothetical protein
MSSAFTFIKRHSDYFPVVLVGLLFIAENELEKRYIHISCQTIISILTASSFFILILFFEFNKYTSALFCFFLWIILVYVKKNIIIV